MFCPKTVNGTTYTYANGAVTEDTTSWGSYTFAQNNKLVLGGDYLKIGPVLLENTGGRVDVSVVNLGNKNKYRGALAAVQVAVPVPTTFTVTATSEGQGTVAIGQGTPGATVSVDGTFGTPVETTLTATAAAGYLFDHWEGPLGLLTSGTASDATVSVRTSMPAEFKAVFLRDDIVATATWTGAGTAGDLSDTNNWLCANSSGVTIEGGLPGADTTIIITGQTAFSFPELTVEINVGSGNDCQCFARCLRITQTGTIKINAASAGALQIDASSTDFSAANLQFEGNAFLFLAGNNTGSILVKDFTYTNTRNYWAAHANAARKVVVGGVYKAGAYRPPVELNNGATLDLSGVSDSWNATGHTGNISKNDTYISNNPGQVTFASGATIAVDLGERAFGQGKTKVVNWATPPTNVTFVRGAEVPRDISFKLKDDGLYACRPVGVMILVR